MMPGIQQKGQTRWFLMTKTAEKKPAIHQSIPKCMLFDELAGLIFIRDSSKQPLTSRS
jgi:hypothetical protein